MLDLVTVAANQAKCGEVACEPLLTFCGAQ